jgi:hypothetical protein
MQTPSILRETCRFCFGSFPTRVRPPPLYISEDHGTTQPIKNQSTTSFPLLWTFPTSATRYVGVLGGLTDPRTTLLYPPWWVFSRDIREFYRQRTGVYTAWPTCWSSLLLWPISTVC